MPGFLSYLGNPGSAAVNPRKLRQWKAFPFVLYKKGGLRRPTFRRKIRHAA
jgi:hypothetical protein